MSPTFESLGIDRLSVDERIALAQEIWDSIADEVERMPLTAAQIQELERRLADSIARPDAVTPWEEVKARALARQAGAFIREQDVTVLTNRDRDRFMELLDDADARPNAALTRAAERYKETPG